MGFPVVTGKVELRNGTSTSYSRRRRHRQNRASCSNRSRSGEACFIRALLSSICSCDCHTDVLPSNRIPIFRAQGCRRLQYIEPTFFRTRRNQGGSTLLDLYLRGRATAAYLYRMTVGWYLELQGPICCKWVTFLDGARLSCRHRGNQPISATLQVPWVQRPCP